jgi:hypothetical protein
VATVQMLVDKGADVNFAPFEGNHSLHLALALAGAEDMRNACVQLVKMLLKAGASANAVDNQAHIRKRTLYSVFL